MSPEQKQFLADNRYCVIGYNRKSGPPALSPVYYVMDGDDILISTQADRTKSQVLARRPEVSVCVLSEKPHPSPPYITVYGRATIVREGAADLMMRVGEAMTGSPVAESVRPAVEKRAAKEQRVVLRITPERIIGR